MDIVVAADLGDHAQQVVQSALPWAARLGAPLNVRAVSSLIWVGDDVFGGLDAAAIANEWQRHRAEEERALEALTEGLPASLSGHHEVVLGRPDHVLVKASADADLLILGTQGRQGLSRMFLGSVAEQTLRAAACPVVVMPYDSAPIPAGGQLTVVAPVDASLPHLGAVSLLQEWFGGDLDLHLVYVLEDLGVSKRLGLAPAVSRPEWHPHYAWARKELRQACIAAGLQAQIHIEMPVEGRPAPTLAHFALDREAHLIAMPTHGRMGLHRLAFGSVTERTVRLAPCPTLVVR